MNFKFFIISIILTSGFVGSVFAQMADPDIPQPQREFSQEEIDEMKHKAVLITMEDGTFMIELFAEDAPNTVNNFLTLVESGYYDGIVFHRIIPGFMIQAGDPQTKNPEIDRSSWGSGGPGYMIKGEFNNLEHDRGILSMARTANPHSAGSQFFIMHKDANGLDGKYTVFGRLIEGTHSHRTLDMIASIETDGRDAPLDVSKATILKTEIIGGFTATDFPDPDRLDSIITKSRIYGGITDRYINSLHNISFDLPYRWDAVEAPGDNLKVMLEPTELEHNVQEQIKQSGFTPQIVILSEERNPSMESAGLPPAFFSLQSGEDPKILNNYIFENDAGRKAHLMITAQDIQTESGTVEFKMIQLHFVNSESSYSIIYLNVTEWFRYEIQAFFSTVDTFEAVFDGEMQNINFTRDPVFRQVFADAKAAPGSESFDPMEDIDTTPYDVDSKLSGEDEEAQTNTGGCLIATASYGSELAPQVQQLRELRDNTVLQTESGSAFMAGFNQFYYSFSPAIADYERENPIFKEAVKLMLTPLLTSLTLLQYADIDSEPEMLGYGISVILLNIGIYFIAPAVLITKIRSFYKLQ